MRSILFAAALFLSPVLPATSQTLEARPDTLRFAIGLPFLESGVLTGNDLVDPADSVQVVFVTPPMHGRIEEDGAGKWRYVADDGFLGEDSFTYRIQTLPLQRLFVSAEDGQLQFASTLTPSVAGLGDASDEETIPVQGELLVELGPDLAAVDSVRVIGLDLTNPGEHSLRYQYGSPIVIASLRIRAAPGALRLSMADPGSRSGTNGPLHSWTQSGNTMSIAVQATLEGSGLFTNQVPAGVQELETEATESLGGILLTSGDQIVLFVNVDSNQAFDLDGSAVTLSAKGTLQGVGTFVPQIQSGETTVTVFASPPTSTDPVPQASELKLDVYPNPATGTVHVRLGVESGFHDAVLEVYDLLGRLMPDPVWNQGPGAGIPADSGMHEMVGTLDTSNWSPGVYLIRVTGPASSEIRTFVRL